MKNQFLFTVVLWFLTLSSTIAQHKKSPAPFEDIIEAKNIYLQSQHDRHRLTFITNKNIQQLLSCPLKVKHETGEMTQMIYYQYTYPFGVIYIEEGSIDNIEFKAKGLAYIFKINNKFSKPISVGDDARYLGVIFPKSRKMMRENILIVWIKNTDSSISFEIDNGYIKSMTFFTNES